MTRGRNRKTLGIVCLIAGLAVAPAMAEDVPTQDFWDHPDLRELGFDEYAAVEASLAAKLKAVQDGTLDQGEMIADLTPNEYLIFTFMFPDWETETFDICNLGAAGRILGLEGDLGGDDWQITMTRNYVTHNGILLPKDDNETTIPTLPARLDRKRGGYDLYIASRKVPDEVRWQSPGDIGLDVTVDEAFAGASTLRGEMELLANCGFEDMPTMISYREMDNGWDQTIMWPQSPDYIIGITQSQRRDALATYHFQMSR
ncbi:hypothetical protein [Yoonia sp. 208BN28-4]|uniref:hypothetical protein n=1 Tax=Yoonia sp. 208BN28-4 TaxID=3126505 RepID=UPI00309C7C66